MIALSIILASVLGLLAFLAHRIRRLVSPPATYRELRAWADGRQGIAVRRTALAENWTRGDSFLSFAPAPGANCSSLVPMVLSKLAGWLGRTERAIDREVRWQRVWRGGRKIDAGQAGRPPAGRTAPGDGVVDRRASEGAGDPFPGQQSPTPFGVEGAIKP
jgi:hypothetical protein